MKSGRKIAAAIRPPIQRLVPALDAADGQRNQQAGDRDEVVRVPTMSKRGSAQLRLLAEDQEGPDGADDREGDVEPEDPVPGEGGQRAAEDRAEDGADGGDDHVGAEGDAELLAGEGVGDDGRAIRHHERARRALDDADDDEFLTRGGEARYQRGEAEDAGADTKRFLRPNMSAMRPAVRTSTVCASM